MANKQYESGYKSFGPDDVHEVDMDRRADWNETDELDPSFILNKPDVADPSSVPKLPSAPAKAASDKTYILKVKSDGTLSWVESDVYTAV